MSEPSCNRSAWPHRVIFSAILAALVFAQPMGAAAQQDLLVPARSPPLRWWHGAIVLGGLSALMLLDNPTRQFVQDRRSASADRVAHGFRHIGQPEVYATVTLGLVATGLAAGNSDLTRAGGRLALTLGLAGGASSIAKVVLGRPRPNESLDADGYVPFSGQDAMPSGHTTMAFALATSLADDIHRPWATVGLYTLATGVAWSRVNDNRHWLSDVAAGATLGITSAKLVNGHWRLFGLRPPGILLGPQGASLAWQVQF